MHGLVKCYPILVLYQKWEGFIRTHPSLFALSISNRDILDSHRRGQRSKSTSCWWNWSENLSCVVWLVELIMAVFICAVGFEEKTESKQWNGGSWGGFPGKWSSVWVLMCLCLCSEPVSGMMTYNSQSKLTHNCSSPPERENMVVFLYSTRLFHFKTYKV